ncbi:MAG: anthranilate synthase component I family protein [Phycisphaerales bacterium]|nr:anthranilate synthase component I family protein [Phycisphaerales bacterium]
MISPTLVHALDWEFDPHHAMARWRCDVPLLALTSGGNSAEFDRWTILAPRTASIRVDATASGAHELLAHIRALTPACEAAFTPANQRLPFASGWIGFIGYECGALFEPHARAVGGAHATRNALSLPDAVLCRVGRALVYEHATQQWFEVGDPNAPEVAALVDDSTPLDCAEWSALDGGELHRVASTPCFADLVARTIEFIRAGDLFQANITQEFRAAFTGSSRAFALDALECASPRYGAYLELDDERALLSLSPELFLSVDGSTRTVTTRPIKGSRPSLEHINDLLESEKDAAELHMIVDLMRSDLGRVCSIGSVRVETARALESHPTILHAVAEVSGRLAPRNDLADLIAATFPAGSITGAPKVRAMQVIDELETTRRGPYCGAIGFSSGCGSSLFNVAIRTAALTRDADTSRWNIDYRAGCGIVAESDPIAEDAECLDKTVAMRNILADEERSARCTDQLRGVGPARV